MIVYTSGRELHPAWNVDRRVCDDASLFLVACLPYSSRQVLSAPYHYTEQVLHTLISILFSATLVCKKYSRGGEA